nr:immunoglobulin light chain junction region [Macaca mulatta]
CQQHDNSPPTL